MAHLVNAELELYFNGSYGTAIYLLWSGASTVRN